MYSITSNRAEQMKLANCSSPVNKPVSKTVGESTKGFFEGNYPFSLLLVENEEDCFVKGYN